MASERHWTPSQGDLVGGRYEIKSEFGEGGIAKVWKGVDQRDGKTVAVKHISRRMYSDDPKLAKDLFHKEIEALRKIQNAGGHENIIDLYDTVSEHGTQLAVVEAVEGKELDDEDLSFTSQEAKRVVIDLADAMAFLHRNEIIYRDLKPDNAMLRPDGSPILIDFNTAKQLEDEVQAGLTCPNCETSVDTSDYMCPHCGESFEGSTDTRIGGGEKYKPPEADTQRSIFRQGPWSDVYSLGKILHNLVADHSVPSADGVGPQDFAAPDACPDYMNEIVKRATKEDTGERYNNANVFKIVLEREDPDPPVSARLTHQQRGREYEIEPGDTIGRRGADGPEARITVDDPGGKYISAVQVEFDVNENNRWILRDRSLNGTYIQRGSGWERVLCENGRQRLLDKGGDPTDRHGNIPPESTPLGNEALIALVDPTYNVSFTFRSEI